MRTTKEVSPSTEAGVVANSETITSNDVGNASAVLNAVPANSAETIVTTVATSKAQKANQIFTESYAQSPVPQRKDILARAVAEADLTPAGAATYLQNFKAKHHLTKPRTTPVA